MNAAVVVRRFLPSDILDASRILESSPEAGLSPVGLRLLCRRPGVFAQVALFAGSRRAVGLSAYQIHPRHYHLLTLAVLPGARRLGVGTALAADLTRKLEPGRRTRVVLECCDHNDPAISFYRALGFRATGLARDGAGEGRDAIRFEFRLPGPTGDLRDPGAWCATGHAEWEC